ncbi:hypothetical protein ACQPZA_23795 [Pseudonocardia xinjiangensis]|uniref:hypothetical protein n=1 Tax=Pseudonocardia xinjiangensis TaxID=75289 RepID=UPI003D91D198
MAGVLGPGTLAEIEVEVDRKQWFGQVLSHRVRLRHRDRHLQTVVEVVEVAPVVIEREADLRMCQ